MESFLLDDISSMIQNKDIERIISPMFVRLCHLFISIERQDMEKEVFASLEMMAKELAKASEDFVQVAKRLAGDAEERWLEEEMAPVAKSLTLSGRNITLVAQKLRLQPECLHHREELVTTAQQILVNTAKVLLLEDAAITRKTVKAAGWCLTCLDALEAAGDAAALRGSFADLVAALLRLGNLAARGREECLSRAGRQLQGCVPALLAAARGHVRYPRDPQLAASRGHVFALTRKTLYDLLVHLEPGTAALTAHTRNGALTRRLLQLRELLSAPLPERLRGGRLNSPLAAVVWHCMCLAASSVPPEKLRLVARCRRLLELCRVHGLRGTGGGALDPGEECAALQAATEALSQGVRSGLLSQILNTFTDTQSPFQRLVQAALATSPLGSRYNGEGLPKYLQRFRIAFQDQAKQMLRVAHLVLVCCPRQQTGRDMEAAMANLQGLVVRVQQLFSQNPHRSGLDWSPAALGALLQAWARASECLLACFDDVLNIPEFLSMSFQEMTKHLGFLTWALKSGDSKEFSRSVAYLQGRATHIVQVMRRYVGQERDPIFRNGLRVLIHQLEQSSLVLAAAAECYSDGYGPQAPGEFLTMAKHLIFSAWNIREGLDGTNHPDILSPLRDQVQKFDTPKGQPYFILPSLQDSTAPELKYHRVPHLGDTNSSPSYVPMHHPSCPLIPDTCPPRRGSPLPAISKVILAVESRDHQGATSVGTNLMDLDGSAVNAGQEALAWKGPMASEKTTELQEISTLAPSVTDLPREVACHITARTDGLLEATPQLSGRTRETRRGLVTMAGNWYTLCQQLFCHNPTADLSGNVAVFMELQWNLVSVVQLAAKSGLEDLDKKDPDSTGHEGALLQMQSRLEEAEAHAKLLLDKVLISDGLQVPKSCEESIEHGCLQWSVVVQDLLHYMEKLSERQGLFLLPLQQAVKDQDGLQKGLDQATDFSQRLQEAARLSSPLCSDEQIQGEVSFLCKEVHVLTDALLDVAQILASSPKLSPSLSTRFELLCLELTLQAKALTGHLSTINADYEHALREAVCSKLSLCKNPQIRSESSLERMVGGIQVVQGIVAGDQESGPFQEDLLVALENILILTKEVAQRVPVEHSEELGMHVLDWLQWEWAAKAHHAVAQLQAWKGGHSKAWRLLTQCLKPGEEPAKAPEQDTIQFQVHCEEDAAGAAAIGSVDSQGITPRATPESSTGTCTPEPAIPGTTTADLGLVGY